ncbi:MAG: hypothetical protein JO165_02310 [Candidatus Eremiobacteraeota bacterium]|nr:hypothetical protein [Candidatus Eremiobacteraeota bacterium]
MLEILNTVAAFGTFIVISATAVAAVIQLRHMRAGNQLEGLLTVLGRIEDVNFNRWVTDIEATLPAHLDDPEFRRALIDATFDRTAPWLLLANSYDWVGSLIKNKLIPEAAFMDTYSFRVTRAWELLADVTALVRSGPAGIATWENFEYLYVRATEWDERYPNGNYPPHVKRAVLPTRYLGEFPPKRDLNSAGVGSSTGVQ